MDTVRYQSLLGTLLSIEKGVFFTGLSGVGKTSSILDLFNQPREGAKKLSPLCLTFSAQTNARKTQETIEGKLVKYRKTLLGAPANSTVVIFIDDVNLPSVEVFGAQPPIELLRQFCDYKGFYDREKLFWKSIADTLVCAAAPPGGGRNAVTPRFIRHFNVLNLPSPPESIMKKIFGSILGGFLNQFKATVQKLKDAIVQTAACCAAPCVCCSTVNRTAVHFDCARTVQRVVRSRRCGQQLLADGFIQLDGGLEGDLRALSKAEQRQDRAELSNRSGVYALRIWKTDGGVARSRASDSSHSRKYFSCFSRCSLHVSTAGEPRPLDSEDARSWFTRFMITPGPRE